MTDLKKNVDAALITRAREAIAAKNEAELALEAHILQTSPYAKGDILRDKDTGFQYRVEGVSAWFGFGISERGKFNASLVTRRCYKTGRSDADTTTNFQYFSGLELIDRPHNLVDYEIAVLREIAGEPTDVIAGAALWEAAEALKGGGYAVMGSTAKGMEYQLTTKGRKLLEFLDQKNG